MAQRSDYTALPNINQYNYRVEQNGQHSANDIFTYIFLKESNWIFIKIWLKFCSKGPNWWYANNVSDNILVSLGNEP